MRILIAHNRYKILGGEETVVRAETELLQARGHEVRLMTRDNHDLDAMSAVAAAKTSLWSRTTATELREVCAQFQPDLLHVHNSFPLLSPSVYWAAASIGVPVVKTLHNFRLVCIQGSLMRDGEICSKCIDGPPLWGTVYRCYRDSLAQSAMATTVQMSHRMLGTYAHKVDAFILMSRFALQMLRGFGLPADRLHVKPNFAPSTEARGLERNGFLYVGRLSAEKGVSTLAAAAAALPGSGFTVIGVGPQASLLENAANVRMLGRLEAPAISDHMQRARALVVSSTAYEGCPMVILEAYANGLPVIASRRGSIPEFVEDGVTGLLFQPGNGEDLANKIRWATDHPEAMAEFGRRALERHRERYTPEQNYQMLMSVYESAMARHRSPLSRQAGAA